MSFKSDTRVPYMVEGSQQSVELSYLSDLFVAVDKPIIALSLTKEGILQQANAVQVGVMELQNVSYEIIFTDGRSVICTGAHKWSMNKAGNSKTLTTSPLTGFKYQATQNLIVGDEIVATNQDKFLRIASIVQINGAYTEYLCMKVPMFGNFLVDLNGVYIISSTC